MDTLEPDAALAAAQAIEPQVRRRRTADDYIPAMDVLMGKGYSMLAAAEHLVDLGAPYEAVSLRSAYIKARRKSVGG